MLKQKTLTSEAGDDVTPETIVRDLKSRDVETQLEAVRAAHAILCSGDPYTSAMVQAGVIAPLVEALDRNGRPDLQYQALDVLNTVAFGSCTNMHEHATAVVNSGAIPKFINFLAREGDLSELAIVTLGNLALHGAGTRDAVLAHGAVRAMLPHMRADTSVKLLRTFVRTYSILCSHKGIKLELVSPALPYIYELLEIKDDGSIDLTEHGLSIPIEIYLSDIEERKAYESEYRQRLKHKIHVASDVVEDVCTALTNIMHGGDECVKVVQAVPGLTSRLVALLQHEVTNVKEAALTAVGNMLGGTDAQVDRCLEANCLEHIVSLLQSSNTSLVQEAARATSNILSGTHYQIQKALDEDILTPLRGVLANGNPACRKKVGYAVKYLCIKGSAAQRAQLVSRGVLEPCCALLATPDRTLAGAVLDSLHVLLQDAERDGNVKPLCYMLDAFDVLDQIQTLQEHTTDEGHRRKILDMSVTLRKHAREERSIVHDQEVFTSEKIVRALQSLHQATQTRAARAAYYMLREQHPPIHGLLEAGIMAPLVEVLDRNACSDHLYVAAWALSNITAGTQKHKMAVIDSGAIPKLLALLARGDKVAELAACSLGNLAAHGPETRDAVRACTRDQAALEELRTCVRGYENWCRQVCEKSTGSLELVLRALPFVSELLDIGDRDIMNDACWILAHITQGSNEDTKALQAVLGFTARLAALLGHEETDVKRAALYALGNMFLKTKTQEKHCLDAGYLDRVISLLQCSEPSLVEVAAGVTCNIFMHTHLIQQALNRDVLTTLRNILASGEYGYRCKILAAYTIKNFCINGTAAQRAQLVSRGVLAPYCALLATPEGELAAEALYGLSLLIKNAGDDDKILKTLCLKLNTTGVIELLQTFLTKLENESERKIDKKLRLQAAELSVILRRQVRGEHLILQDGKVFTPAEIVLELQSQDLATRKRAARAAWSLLSLDDPPRTAMIQAGVIAPLVAALGRDDCSELQVVAVSALHCIVRGIHNHRVAVVNSGAIPKLVALVAHGGETAERAALTLGRMIFRAPVSRDLVLAHGALGALLRHMRVGTPVELLRTCLKTYYYLCKYIFSASSFWLVSPALPYLSEILHNIEDNDVLKFVCHSLRALSYSPPTCIITEMQTVPGLTARLIALLGHEAPGVQAAALSVMTNMLYGTQTQSDHCLDAGCFDHIASLLQSSEPTVVEMAAGAARNVMCNRNFMQRAPDMGILSTLMKIMSYAESNSFLQCNAVGALANVALYGTDEHKLVLVTGGVISELVAALSHEAPVAEPAAMALGQLASLSPASRDFVLAHEAMRAMLPHMLAGTPVELLKSCMKAYKNFCKHCYDQPTEKLELLFPALPYISQLLRVEDIFILEDACWALVELTKTVEGIEAVQAVPGLTARLGALLRHVIIVKISAITAVMLMLSGTDDQVDRCLDADYVGHIISYLRCRDPALMQEAAEATRATLGAKHPHVQRALNKDLFTPLMRILACAPRGQKRTVKAITSLCRRATAAQHAQLVSRGVLEPYCALLATPDRTLAGEVLDSLDVLLQVAVNDNSLKALCLKLVEIGILDQLKVLREHEDKQVNMKARGLLHAYFPGES